MKGIYDYLEEQMKPETWRLLHHLHTRTTLPWLCIGDYNEILYSKEKNGGIPKALPPMLQFHNALLRCSLMDLGYKGYWYTWRNGQRGDAFVEERLDRACASLEWLEVYPATKVSHVTASYSDHEPIILDTTPFVSSNNQRQHKIQRFKEKWVSHPECEEKIRESWTHAHTSSSPMNRLFEKIKKCHADLVAWSNSVFSNTRGRLNAKQTELDELVQNGYEQNLEHIWYTV